MILTVCLSPCLDVTVELDALEVGKTNVAKRKRVRAGGKALNVALNAAKFGESAVVTGFMYEIGKEPFVGLLKESGVEDAFVLQPGRVRENYKFIDHKSMLTEVNDVGAAVSDAAKEEVLRRVAAISEKCDVTVLSGSAPNGVEAEFYARLLSAVSPRCLRIADASGKNLLSAVSAGVDLVKPNLAELENCLGRELPTQAEMLSGCRELIALGAKRVLLSLGRQGAICTDGRESYFCRSNSVAVNSTVGAGDAMVAAAALRLKEDAPLPAILRSGVAAGTAAVTTFDESAFSLEKYEELYHGLQISKIE